MDSKDLQKIMEEMTSVGVFRKYESYNLPKDKAKAKREIKDLIESNRLSFEKSVYFILPNETGGYSITKYAISRSDLIRALQEDDM